MSYMGGMSYWEGPTSVCYVGMECLLQLLKSSLSSNDGMTRRVMHVEVNEVRSNVIFLRSTLSL